ncbi:MAG: carboxypeptidase regulatory-like domain-containing protein [Candidatus Acidiferrum sp.]
MRQFLRRCLKVNLVLLLFFSAPGTRGQSIVTGGISGVVTDPTGAIVGGANLSLKNVGTGESYSAVSSASGEYVFALLKPGNYMLSVTKDGFKTSTRTINVLLGTTVSVNVALEIGVGTTTVEVSAEQGAELQTENANISTNFETKQIQEIPNPGGDVTYIAQTAPGVTMGSSAGGGYGNFSTFGLPGTSNLFTMNGNDYNDPFLNLNNSGSSNLLLGGNELQEVSVVNNGYTGQYGRQAASQIDYSTKSGTNSFHGNLVYNWTGRELNANDPILKGTTPVGSPIPTRPFENNNQWAASLGGPIKKDKAFFFINTEGIRYIFGSIHPVNVPTPAFQSYVLGNIPQDSATQGFYQNLFKLWNSAPNIATATPNAGSCSANGLPATIGGDQCTESWTDSSSSGNKEWLISARVDYSFSEKDKIFGRVKFDRGVQPTYTDTINPTFDTFSTQPQNEGQLNYTHIFTPTVVNNFIGSVLYYSALFGNVSPGSPALGLIPGNLAFTDGSLTNLGFGAGAGGYANGFFFPQGRNVTQWGLVDDLSFIKGNHSFKTGINWRRDDISDHTAAETSVYPAVNTTLLGFANDEVASFTQYNFATSAVQPVAFYSFGVYFQDEYRVNAKLKLTMTLRADRNSGGVCQHNCAGLPVEPFPDLTKGADIPYDQSYLTGKKTIIPGNEFLAWQPRFGFAWTPGNAKTVLRGGVGLFADLYPGTILSGIDTNFPQVNQWVVPGGTLAWDTQSPATTAFPTSGVALVQQCNAAFNSNYYSGGSLTTYLATPGLPASCATTPTLNDVTRNLQNPKYLEWNLEVQHQLTPHTIVSANYVGNRGYDELYFNNYLNGFGYGSLTNTTAPDPRVGRVNYLQSGAISNYNGLTVSLQENSWHGLSGRVNYTLSHALDESSNGGILPFSIFYSVLSQINPAGIQGNYASADYDARHQISGSYVYVLPFKSSNHLLDAVVGGWQLSGTLFWRTGFPFSVVDGAQVGGLAGNNLTGATILLQPTFVQRNFTNVGACVASPCFGILAGGGNPAVNPTAPYQFEPGTNFTGDVAGRNAFRGPGFLAGDMSLRKNFQISERMNFQLGMNAYNWLNHANYGAPFASTAFGPTNFGTVIFTQTPPTSPYGAFASAATDMRMVQITAKLVF